MRIKHLLPALLLFLATGAAVAQSPGPCFPEPGQQHADPLRGKRIGVIGDSYVRNHQEPVENTWHYKFARKHGMEYHNYGINGNCVSVSR